MSPEEDEAEKACTAVSVGLLAVHARIDEVYAAIRQNGGLAYGIFVAYAMPCSARPNAFHDETTMGIEDDLDPEDVVELRRQLALYKARLDAMYPPA